MYVCMCQDSSHRESVAVGRHLRLQAARQNFAQHQGRVRDYRAGMGVCIRTQEVGFIGFTMSRLFSEFVAFQYIYPIYTQYIPNIT